MVLEQASTKNSPNRQTLKKKETKICILQNIQLTESNKAEKDITDDNTVKNSIVERKAMKEEMPEHIATKEVVAQDRTTKKHTNEENSMNEDINEDNMTQTTGPENSQNISQVIAEKTEGEEEKGSTNYMSPENVSKFSMPGVIIPSPFKKALFWPEATTSKKPSKKEKQCLQ